MKTLITKSLSIICITALSMCLFNSCKKYPDGPTFTLLTKNNAFAILGLLINSLLIV